MTRQERQAAIIMRRIRRFIDTDPAITRACANMRRCYGGDGIGVEIDLTATISVIAEQKATAATTDATYTEADQRFLQGMRIKP